MEVVEREFDALGRIVIPKAWRKQLGKHLWLYKTANEVRVIPKSKVSFLELDKIKADVASKLDDWHSVEKELLE